MGGCVRRTRRRALQAGVVGAAAGLAALSPVAARAAKPQRAAGRIRLVVSVAYQGAGTFQGTMQHIVDSYIAAHWLPSHPGVEVRTIAGMGCNGTCLSSADEIAASLAGAGADVITGCCNDWYNYVSADMLRPLDPFVKRDNLDLSVFSAGHLAGLTTPQGLLALPEYDGPMVMAVNLGMLDALGLPYPRPDWTHEDAVKLWRAVSGTRSGKYLYWGDAVHVAGRRHRLVGGGLGRSHRHGRRHALSAQLGAGHRRLRVVHQPVPQPDHHGHCPTMDGDRQHLCGDRGLQHVRWLECAERHAQHARHEVGLLPDAQLSRWPAHLRKQ